jgi:hypothetical protein
VRQKQAPVMMLGLLEKATRRLVQREIRRAQWIEQAVPCQ